MQRTPHTRDVPAVDQLAAGGIHPGDIAAIIPTHSHWDHVSGVDDFRGVPVMETGGKTLDRVQSRRHGGDQQYQVDQLQAV